MFPLTKSNDYDILIIYLNAEIFMNLLDTIAAVSTPFGLGGIAVIRISGSHALEVADRVFKPCGSVSMSKATPNMSYYGGIFFEDAQIDDGIAVYFAAPRSFTGEDTVEISCHGGILITQKVLSAVLCAGARAATAGEFTRRAFINGKMKLSGAEALGDLLHAQTDEQITLARAGMKGILSQKTDLIYNSIGDILSAVYAHIDYPDEDLADMSAEDMLSVTDKNIQKLNELCATYKTGRAVSEGIETVIAGRTNSGKSSLYNAIIGRDAAIVTDIEGTTRDILTETATLGRVVLRLSDTAGLRDTGDIVEKIGIERARAHMESAELILAVFDGSVPPTQEDRELATLLFEQGKVAIAVLNKSDLGICREAVEFADQFEYNVTISAQSGEGMDSLCNIVENIYIDKSLNTGSDAIISNARQYSAVSKALMSLTQAREHLILNSPLEVSCSCLEAAMAELGELDGRRVTEDIVSKIFANFCVGK